MPDFDFYDVYSFGWRIGYSYGQRQGYSEGYSEGSLDGVLTTIAAVMGAVSIGTIALVVDKLLSKNNTIYNNYLDNIKNILVCNKYIDSIQKPEEKQKFSNFLKMYIALYHISIALGKKGLKKESEKLLNNSKAFIKEIKSKMSHKEEERIYGQLINDRVLEFDKFTQENRNRMIEQGSELLANSLRLQKQNNENFEQRVLDYVSNRENLKELEKHIKKEIIHKKNFIQKIFNRKRNNNDQQAQGVIAIQNII